MVTSLVLDVARRHPWLVRGLCVGWRLGERRRGIGRRRRRALFRGRVARRRRSCLVGGRGLAPRLTRLAHLAGHPPRLFRQPLGLGVKLLRPIAPLLWPPDWRPV